MASLYDILAPALGICIAITLLLVLVLVIRGSARKFWVVLAYVAWELFATAALTIADMLYRGTANVTHNTATAAQLWYGRAYWTNDVLVDLFRFMLVIVLIYKAADGPRRSLGRALTALVLVMVALPFAIFHTTFTPYPTMNWFNSTSELLNFGAAVMNLILWGQLLVSKRRDPQILMVSLGLGVVVTGTAMLYGFRHLLPEATWLADLLLNLVQLVGWTTWCRAFWPTGRSSQLSSSPAPLRRAELRQVSERS